MSDDAATNAAATSTSAATVASDVATSAPSAASAAPAGVLLAPHIAPAASASLSSLIQQSDLAYPELAPRYVSSRNLPTASPWRAKHIPNPLAALPYAPMPSKPIAPVESSLRERVQAGLSQIDGFTASPMKPSAAAASTCVSSRALLDPTSRLLESLWAAEDDFERMLAEDLPEVARDRRTAMTPQRDRDARRREEANKFGLRGEHQLSPAPRAAVPASSGFDRTPARRSQRSARSSPAPAAAAAAVHFAPGSLLPPADEITAAYIDPPSVQSASPLRPSASLRHATHPSLSPSQRDLQRAITSALQPGQRFLHVSEWDGQFEPDAFTAAALASTADPAAGISSTAAPAVLIGVQDFSMPADLCDLLDVDVDHRGKLVRFDADKAFGRLLPLRVQHILRQVEKHPAKDDEEEKQQESQGRSQQAFRAHAAAAAHASSSPPRSLSALAALHRDSSSSPRIFRSHLHSAPDPAVVHRAVAVRAAQDSMREIDDDLAALEAQAAALSAEYQSDSRKLAAYQARIQARSQHALSHQLDAVQQQWLHAQQTSEQARRTLSQIDAIMAAGDTDANPSRVAAAAQPTASQPASARRPQSARASTTPRGASTAVPSTKHRNVQHSPPRASRTEAAAAAPAATVASASAPTRRSITASNSSSSLSSRSVRPSGPTKPALPATRFVKTRKTAGKLEGELDSALQQAQKLMEHFMGNI